MKKRSWIAVAWSVGAIVSAIARIAHKNINEKTENDIDMSDAMNQEDCSRVFAEQLAKNSKK